MNNNWEEWEKSLGEMCNHHGKCDRCGRYLIASLLYKYIERTYISTFEDVDITVNFDYLVCSTCLFDLISHRYLKGGAQENG
jgi:hypothetical protein